MPEERLQKILSRAGVASRRKAEELITAGRVTVNGEVITTLGSKADLDRDHIKVNGKLLREPKRRVYLALNKPDGYVTTLSDPQGRQTIVDLLRGVRERVYPVGRLDYHSEGLLLLTNDGELANALMAPSSHIEKTYLAKVNGALSVEEEEKFRKGVPLMGRATAPARIFRIKEGDNPWYEITITEGRNQQIRLMFKHFGKLVEKLRRVRVGPLKLDVKPGEFRHLTPQEVGKLQREVERKRKGKPGAGDHR